VCDLPAGRQVAEAVARHPVDLERVSFKGRVDALRQYSAAIAHHLSRKITTVNLEP
jgi:hypothetical protein